VLHEVLHSPPLGCGAAVVSPCCVVLDPPVVTGVLVVVGMVPSNGKPNALKTVLKFAARLPAS